MSGKVLAAMRHAGLQQAVHQALGEHRDDAGIAVERAVADHAAGTEIEIEHRREAEVDAAGAQLGGQHEAAGGGRVGGTQRVGHPLLAEHAHRRQVGETVGAKALHAAAFVVDADQQVWPQRLDLGGEFGELVTVQPVAREQDQPASERMPQTTPVVGVQRQAFDVENHRGVWAARRGHRLRESTGGGGSCGFHGQVSTTTKLVA